MLATAPGLRRTPLAPLDLQLSMNKDMDMTNEEAFQAPRKASIPLTNATRPTPYVQRNLPRRYTQGQRRTSLPALHHTYDSGLNTPSPLPNTASAVSHPEYVHDDENDIYSRLSTFTFGDAQSSQFQLVASSSRSTEDTLTESLSPLDKTPRPSVAYSASRKPSAVNTIRDNGGWSSPSSDEEERRRSTRAKMRAIDDGTRRPSLPTNDNEHASKSGPIDKGKGREIDLGKSQHPASPSEAELDTDVDLMSVSADDTERQRRDMHKYDTSRSDLGSVFGGEGEEETSEEPSGEKDGEVDVHRKDSTRTWTESTMNRRGSLPMDIPNASRSSHGSHPHHDDYSSGIYSPEFDARARAQAQLRRPSRSVDDDLQRAARNLQRKASHVSVTASVSAGSGHSSLGMENSLGSGPSSEPDMRGVAMAQAIAQAHLDARQQAENTLPNINDEPYQGLDLNYILSGTGGPSSGLNKQGSDGWSGRLSVGSSVVASREQREREREPSWAAGWSIAGGRRQSTATVNDDTFLRFVKRHDLSYDERKREWTFMRERADNDNWPKPGQEIWRCLWVGRYRVDRVHSKNADTTKPLQVRLNIRHLPDPYTKAGSHGGPLTFIHKHSRAQAFSIFRGHSLPQRHLKTSSSILLAPKKVQEQFTSTRTTSKLSTHGLLEDASTGTVGSVSTTGTASGTGRSHQTASGSGTNSATTSSTSVGSSRGTSSTALSIPKKMTAELSPTSQHKGSMLRLKVDRERERHLENIDDLKGKGVIRSPIATENSGKMNLGDFSIPEANSQDPETSQSHLGAMPMANSVEASHRPTSSIAETASLVSEGSQQFSSALSAWDQSSIGSSQRDSLWSAHPRGMDLLHQLQSAKMNAAARGSVGSLEDAPIRTSHAEAFATLDPPFIEYLRNHSANYDGGPEHDSQPSRFRGLRKLFHPQPQRSATKHSPQGPPANAAVLEGHYTPPWLTMAARSKQEEQERVIKNLNASFRDVGLLPTFKPSRNRETKKGKRINENVFDQIPDDALYMLLPMWPGETDPNSASESEAFSSFDIPLHERQYLLVYYVPNELDKKKTDDKKRMRSQTPSGSSLYSDASTARLSKNIVALSSFNILARLVSYKDVNGSGIRVPTTGLSVSGPMEDAVRAIPQIRFQVDDLALIIAFCASRDRGVEVVPEGVEKLGLCLPRTSPDPDSDAPLSSLGRAAVEMAWLGALAVMGFGNVS